MSDISRREFTTLCAVASVAAIVPPSVARAAIDLNIYPDQLAAGRKMSWLHNGIGDFDTKIVKPNVKQFYGRVGFPYDGV
jgi:hypothetical protein